MTGGMMSGTTKADQTASDRVSRAFDADNHYYEATDAFTRHVSREMQSRCMTWAEIHGKQRLLVGGRVNRFIPNPTFDPVAKPGALIEYFRGKVSVEDLGAAFGELDPIQQAYRDPAERLQVMDSQGLDAALLFPTLGVGMENSLKHDREALLTAFGGFNRWLLDDWSYNYENRLYSTPYLTLADPRWAVSELEFVIEHGARVINMRPGPVEDPSGNRSLGDPRHDAFWQVANDAGITVAFHAGDAGYGFMLEKWGIDSEFRAFQIPAMFTLLTMSPISDSMASLLADGVFMRFPKLRVATIENGAEWVRPLFDKLEKVHKMRGHLFSEDPRETFRKHVWVAPFYENDLSELAELIGVDHILFGSDWPHAEGLADPLSFVEDLEGAGFNPGDIDKVMYSNTASLVIPPA